MPEIEPFWLSNPVATNFYITACMNEQRRYGPHEGIDLNAIDAFGRPVDILAAQRGFVERVVHSNEGYGQHVRLKHEWPDGSTYFTWYGHMSQIDVKKGDFVSIGQKLGVAGSTGYSTGIHLHLTLQHIGHGMRGYWLPDIVDPVPYFHHGAVRLSSSKELQFVGDVTVPDGTLVQPGTPFTKTWRIINSGTEPWAQGFKLVFLKGERMGSTDSVDIPPAEPGQQVVVSVPLVAPTVKGRHRGVWKPCDTEGQHFEFEIWVEIVVAGEEKVDNAKFLSDVTVPDYTVKLPGQTFLKTWRVQNNGTTIWGTGYRLTFFSGERMGAPESLPIPHTSIGEETELSVTLKAPEIRGVYRSTWKLRDPRGQDFGEPFFALIKVEGEPTPGGLDELTLVSDITHTDAWNGKPGQQIEKIWRVRNTGDTTWGAGYVLAFFADEQMGGPDSVSLPAIDPGQTADISINLITPQEAGIHRSTWKPRNPLGKTFDHPLDVKIQVFSPLSPGELVDDAVLVAHMNVYDGTIVQAGQIFLKTWRIRNIGSTTWGDGYALVHFSGDPMGSGANISLPVVEPGQIADLSINLTAPLTPGEHHSGWKLRNVRGDCFGNELSVLIRVPSPQLPLYDNRARLENHESVQPGTRIEAGQSFRKGWFVRNIGTSTWGDGYTFVFLEGDQCGGSDSIPVPQTEPQAVARLKADFKAPSAPGIYKGYWRLRDPGGKLFGPRLLLSIEVKAR